MAEAKRTLLTIGAAFIVLVVALLLYAAGVIDWTLIAPVFLVLFGIWIVALAAMRGGSPTEYERSSFSTLSMGLLVIVVGGSWAMLVLGLSWVYALALILLVLAALAIATAVRRK
jgi:hypothetical protein